MKDYIGLKTCTSASTPDSGVYINEFLPGVEWKQIDQIADSDQVDFSGVWEDVQNRAVKKFKTDVIAAMQNRFVDNGFNTGYKLKQITQSVDIGRNIDSETFGVSVGATTPARRGILIELEQSGYTTVYSNLQLIHIQSIPVYFVPTVNAVVKVTDADTGTVLFTKSLTNVTGWQVVNVNESYSSKRVYVTFNITTLLAGSSVVQSLPLNNSIGNSGCGCDGINYCYYNFNCNCRARVEGVKGTEDNQLNTYGLSVIFSIKCAYDNIVCNNKEHFLTSWAYLLGIELMTERIYSSRLNRWTTIDKARAQELRKEFMINYKGGEIDDVKITGELQSAVYGITLDQNDCCIECDAPVRFVNSIM